jgi:hypothetical protein
MSPPLSLSDNGLKPIISDASPNAIVTDYGIDSPKILSGSFMQAKIENNIKL